MNRTKLVNDVGRLAAEAGYEFHTADDRYMPQIVNVYPAMWLSPPQFDSMEGRDHGRITYSVTLHALDAGMKLPPAERGAVLGRMETDIVGLFTSLSQSETVVAVENLRIRAQNRTLTNHGDIAATATADVITFF